MDFTDEQMVDWLVQNAGCIVVSKKAYTKLEHEMHPPRLDTNTGIIEFKHRGVTILWQEYGDKWPIN